MPFQYAHVEFGTDPRQALQRIVRNAEYLLKSAQKCLADGVQQEYLASQGDVETHNKRQLRVWGCSVGYSRLEWKCSQILMVKTRCTQDKT
jgi:hypothetical protein